MKKLLSILLFLFLSILPVFSEENSYRYFLVANDNTPIRVAPNDNADRFTHLKHGVLLYCESQTNDYFGITLNNKNYWVSSKNIIDLKEYKPKKENKIKKIILKEYKDKYEVSIYSNFKTAWSFIENNNNLIFEMYDADFSDKNTKINNMTSNFQITNNEFGNLVLKYNNSNPLFGYDVKLKRNKIILTVKKPPKISYIPLKNIKITIDAGHGGYEKGVVAFGVREKDVNLEISKKLKQELSNYGAKTYMTRNRDKRVPLYERVNKAQNKKSHILISIHQNSLPDIKKVDKKHGVGVYYYNKESLALANSIQNSLLEVTKFKNDGVNRASFALTRPTDPICVLIECGYLISKYEMEHLINKEFQREIAKGIRKGIEEYLIKNFSSIN